MRPFLIVLAVLVALAAGVGAWVHRVYGPWTEWESFASHFIQPDGRVVDITANSRSTSEGQAYSLFFALVANDRARFDQILNWTRNNLADGDFAKKLPAWLWGLKSDGSWGVIDENAASDADLWLAYTLLQAGRLWHDDRLLESGRLVLGLIKSQEIVTAGVWGPVLLPAPQGFVLDGGRFRLNPSYYARFQFEALAQADQGGPWLQAGGNTERAIEAASRGGYAPDWFVVDDRGQVYPDSEKPNVGSYDAIRVYLWAGLSEAIDPAAVSRVSAYASAVASLGHPPEFVDVATGSASGGGPIGFSAAVLPYLKRLGQDSELKMQQKRLREQRVAGHLGQPPHYYDQVLGLFGEGALAKRYRFEKDGRVKVRWESLWVAL